MTGDLDASYREEGWGLITDQAFAGKLRPKDVESQAREVARYAYTEIKALQEHTNRMGTELTKQDRDLQSLQRVADAHARLVPKYQGTRAALLHIRAELRRSEVARAKAERDASSARLKVAEAEQVLAEAAARRGDHDIPSTIEARPLREWLDEHNTETRNDD